jgi:hypothetical protein
MDDRNFAERIREVVEANKYVFDSIAHLHLGDHEHEERKERLERLLDHIDEIRAGVEKLRGDMK